MVLKACIQIHKYIKHLGGKAENGIEVFFLDIKVCKILHISLQKQQHEEKACARCCKMCVSHR